MISGEVDSPFFALPNVLESVSLALKSYKATTRGHDRMLLTLVKPPDTPHFTKAPTSGSMPASLYQIAMSKSVA
jgi:hypothetical protein